jgi:hypothetical protein
VRRLLVEDREFRAYFEGETTDLPPFFLERMREDLGPFWDWLPEGAIHHDPSAYLAAEEQAARTQAEAPTADDAAAGG